MFQTKVVEFEGGIQLVWFWLMPTRSGQGHFEFFKWNPPAFIAYIALFEVFPKHYIILCISRFEVIEDYMTSNKDQWLILI